MSDARRVLFVEGSQGGVTGGSLTGLLPIMAALRREGGEPHLILHESKRVIREIVALGVPVTIVPRRRVPKEHRLQGRSGYEHAKQRPGVARALRTARMLGVLGTETIPSAVRLAAAIRRIRPDVVHLGNGFRNNADGILAARLARRPSVCHVKGFERYGPVERRVARLTAVGVCMSQAVQAHCIGAGVSAPVMRVIPDALDPEEFHPVRQPAAVRWELGISGRWPVLGVVGQIQEWKGQHVAIAAVDRLHARFPHLVCLIIGGVRRARGNEKAAERYAERLLSFVNERRLGHHVRLLGERRDVPDLVGALDALLHTSVQPEPFGRVVLEGMALERPVIATRGGGIPEIVVDGETGLLVPPADPEALAEAIEQLCANQALAAAMGHRGRLRLESHFGVRRQVDALRQVYAEAMAAPPQLVAAEEHIP